MDVHIYKLCIQNYASRPHMRPHNTLLKYATNNDVYRYLHLFYFIILACVESYQANCQGNLYNLESNAVYRFALHTTQHTHTHTHIIKKTTKQAKTQA
jgi:hypothetical protein